MPSITHTVCSVFLPNNTAACCTMHFNIADVACIMTLRRETLQGLSGNMDMCTKQLHMFRYTPDELLPS
jgi:hypothetical protein